MFDESGGGVDHRREEDEAEDEEVGEEAEG